MVVVDIFDWGCCWCCWDYYFVLRFINGGVGGVVVVVVPGFLFIIS